MPKGGFDADRSVMRLGNRSSDGESQSGATAHARNIGAGTSRLLPPESIEDVGGRFGVETAAFVRDHHNHILAITPSRQAYRGCDRGVSQGVGDQNADQLRQQGTITDNPSASIT